MLFKGNTSAARVYLYAACIYVCIYENAGINLGTSFDSRRTDASKEFPFHCLDHLMKSARVVDWLHFAVLRGAMKYHNSRMRESELLLYPHNEHREQSPRVE